MVSLGRRFSFTRRRLSTSVLVSRSVDLYHGDFWLMAVKLIVMIKDDKGQRVSSTSLHGRKDLICLYDHIISYSWIMMCKDKQKRAGKLLECLLPAWSCSGVMKGAVSKQPRCGCCFSDVFLGHWDPWNLLSWILLLGCCFLAGVYMC